MQCFFSVQGNRSPQAARFSARLRRLAGLTLLLLPFIPETSHAADWMYRRSYYSHQLPPEAQAYYPQPEMRSALRRPFVGMTPGFAARGGYRINRILLRSGNSTDLTVIYNDWYQLQP